MFQFEPLKTFIRSIRNQLSFIEKWGLKNLLKPKKLQIEISDICNLQCKYCDVHTNSNQIGFIDLDFFKFLVDQATYATHIFPQFWGEPSLHPEFERILEYCKHKKKIVNYYTNATIIHNKDIEKILINTDLMHISIDSIDSNHYESICGENYFIQVKKNIQTLWQTNKNLGFPCKIVIRSTILSKSKAYEQSFNKYWGPYCHEIKWRPLRRLNTNYFPYAKKKIKCEMVIDHCIIKCDGKMVLCCSDRFGDFSPGNVKESSIINEFNSYNFEKLRNNIGLINPCRNCWYRYKD